MLLGFYYICLLQVTSPFRTVEFLDKAIAKFIESDCDSLVSVQKVPHEYNPHWTFELNDEGNLKIATGEIKNWSEVGGEDAPIVVVSREEGSGTRGRIGRTSCVFQPVRDTAKSDKGASIKSLEG